MDGTVDTGRDCGEMFGFEEGLEAGARQAFVLCILDGGDGDFIDDVSGKAYLF